MRPASKIFEKALPAPMVMWEISNSPVFQNPGAYRIMFTLTLRRRNMHCSTNKSFEQLILNKLRKQEPELIFRTDYLFLIMPLQRFFTTTPRQSTSGSHQKYLKVTQKRNFAKCLED